MTVGDRGAAAWPDGAKRRRCDGGRFDALVFTEAGLVRRELVASGLAIPAAA